MTESASLIDTVWKTLKDGGYTHPPYLYGAQFNGKVPYSGPFFDDNELKAAVNALLFGKWAVAGENVLRFEREFSRVIGVKSSFMVNSGSSANLVMMAALKERFGWADGDGMIVATAAFPTSVSTIVQSGLTPVFVDIEMGTLNADSDAIELALKQHNGEDCGTLYVGPCLLPRVRAILVSPVLGNPPDMDRLTKLAKRYGVKLVLDGCDCLSTSWFGKPLPTYFTAASCSFYPSHHISTLGGGMVSSDDDKLMRLVQSFSTWGRACYCRGAANLLPNGVCGCRFDKWLSEEPDLVMDHKYAYPHIGYNVLPLDLQGAIGLEQLKKLPLIHEKRRVAKERIAAMVESIPGISGVTVHPSAEVSWFGVPIIANTQSLKERLMAHFESRNVQCRNYFSGNLLIHEGYKHLGNWRDYPNANEVLKRVLFIGCAPFYTEEHFNHIEKSVKEFTP